MDSLEEGIYVFPLDSHWFRHVRVGPSVFCVREEKQSYYLGYPLNYAH